MADPSLVAGWIKKADENLQYARASFKEELGFYPQICFHLHQAVEKYLKAYIVAKDLNFQKIHDLTKLLKICAEVDTGFNGLSDSVVNLNPYYIETRYPEFIGTIGKVEAEKALRVAEEIAVFIKSKLHSG